MLYQNKRGLAITLTIFSVAGNCAFSDNLLRNNRSPKPGLLFEAIKAQRTQLSRADYEQLAPRLVELKAGDHIDRVLEIILPGKDRAQALTITRDGSSKLLYYPMIPGVLTSFNDENAYLVMRTGLAKGHKPKLQVDELFFGYLDGDRLRPQKIIFFEKNRIKKIVNVSRTTEVLKQQPLIIELILGPPDYRKIYNREYYENHFLSKIKGIITGMYYWEVFTILGANYIVSRYLQSVGILAPGYLNYKQTVRPTRTDAGIHAVYPFGYMDGDNEIVKWEIEMLNHQVVTVRAVDYIRLTE